MKKQWVFIIAILAVYSAGIIGGIFTSSSVDSMWYENIKPGITPPSYVFPIVWNILFFLIALSLFFSWTNAKEDKKEKIAVVFGINLGLNIMWSFLFFGLKNPFFAFIDLILLWFSIVIMILVVKRINWKSALLLIPYLLWVSFAGILNALMI